MPKRGENIYKRKDGRWEGRYIKSASNGTVKWGYVYAKSYKEVKLKLQSVYSLSIQSAAPDVETKTQQPADCFESVALEWLSCTFATRCVELGFDLKSLSEILSHANVNITLNRYVHPSMELKQQNMNLLSDLLTVK